MVQTPQEQIRTLSKPPRKCAAGRAVTEHGDSLQQAIDDPACTDLATKEWLGNQDTIISVDTISKHRRGACACQR